MTPRISTSLYHVLGFLLFVSLTISGCASIKKAFNIGSTDEEGNEIAVDLDLPAKELLDKGMDDYNVGKYHTAIDAFNEILNRYPFSQEAILAELKAADCSYFLGRYAEALLLYESFESRHPTNESIPYIMFQKGMCNFKQIDRIDRDVTGAEKAITIFQQLLKAYPASPYASEAKKRVAEATEFLADHEFVVVQYYLRTEKYEQAKVRLRYLLAMYPDTPVAQQASEILARVEAGDPPRSKLTAWLPKFNLLPDWGIFGNSSEQETQIEPMPQ
jgi:outer membrane protein assembly factor BamD